MLTLEELQILKAKVDKELTRRCWYGTLAPFASDPKYALTGIAGKNPVITAEHGRAVIDPLLRICDHGDLKFVAQSDPIPDSFGSELIAYVDTLARESTFGQSSSCRGACTGLCLGSCMGACGGCTGCNGCIDSCSGTCGTTCSGCTGCGSGCAAGCLGCSSSCGSGCAWGAKSA